jgi:hypothetical protein
VTCPGVVSWPEDSDTSAYREGRNGGASTEARFRGVKTSLAGL